LPQPIPLMKQRQLSSALKYRRLRVSGGKLLHHQNASRNSLSGDSVPLYLDKKIGNSRRLFSSAQRSTTDLESHFTVINVVKFLIQIRPSKPSRNWRKKLALHKTFQSVKD
jgi:hypothetical protein